MKTNDWLKRNVEIMEYVYISYLGIIVFFFVMLACIILGISIGYIIFVVI